MKTKRLVLSGSIVAAGAIALGSIGFAIAQTSADPSSDSTIARHEQMDDHMGMVDHARMGAAGDMPGHSTDRQSAMHEVAAKALGMTVAELDSQLAAGKTMAEIAAAKGIDLATLRAAMHGAHPGDHGADMAPGRMGPKPQ